MADFQKAADGKASSRYAQLTPEREDYLNRARDMASLTVPFLFRRMGENGHDREEIPWESLGAYCVGNLASKIIFSIFPPGTSPVKLSADRKTKMELLKIQDTEAQAALRNSIETGLARVEKEFVEAFEEDGDRAALFIGALRQIVGGTQGFQFYPDGKIRGIPLDRFVCRRDASGNLLEFVIQDPLAWETLPADVKANCVAMGYKEPEFGSSNTPINVYTYGCLCNGRWEVYQECWGRMVAATQRTYEPAFMPYLFAPWLLLEGEHYGRAYVEFYEGDLQTCEGLTQTVTEGAAAAARFLTLVTPGGLTNRKTLAEARNGDYVPGRESDVHTLRADKGGDLQVATGIIDKAEQRLERAFLLFSAVQRNGERVTAEEIRRVAQELEDALGGVYSQQVVTLQLPYCALKLHYLQKNNRVTPLPRDTVKMTITGGLAALGRNSDLAALDDWLGGANQAFGPQAVAEALGPNAVREYLKRRAVARGIDTAGLIPSDDEAKALDAQKQQMAMMQQMGPEAIRQLGSNLTANQVADTKAASASEVAQTKALPAAPTNTEGV